MKVDETKKEWRVAVLEELFQFFVNGPKKRFVYNRWDVTIDRRVQKKVKGQIMNMFKEATPDQWELPLSVDLDGEEGFGKGLVGTFADLVQREILSSHFEGKATFLFTYSLTVMRLIFSG